MKNKSYILAMLLLSFFSLRSTSVATVKIEPDTEVKLREIVLGAFSTLPTIFNTYQIAQTCLSNQIPGDFVECGVAFGAQSAVMAYACQKANCLKKVHLFDSFQGIPLAGPKDTAQPGIGAITHNTNVDDLETLLVSSGIDVISLETVKGCMDRWGIDQSRLMFYEGWFQHTMPKFAESIKEICFLRLDGDLYESTKVCLEYLYPKVSNGGFVVIDDYGLTGCCRAVHEYLDEHNLKPTIIAIPGGLGPVYWQVQK